MARTVDSDEGPSDRILLDSGTTTHMTPHRHKVTEAISTQKPIKLADDSIIQAKLSGTREVNWMTSEGNQMVYLSNTLVAPDVSMSLLSIPALVNKNIAVLFMQKKALLIDLEDEFAILGTATQSDRDGLFYIEDYQD